MKKSTVYILLIGLLFLSACAQAGFEQTSAPTASITQKTTTTAITTTEPMPAYYSKDSTVVFDFAELPESIPHGKWSVNQLAAKYGACENADGQYRNGYGVVLPDARFPGVHISFDFTEPQEFSFFSDDLEDKPDRTSYAFNSLDMNLKLELLGLFIKSPDIELPRGLRIGCTKEEVLAAYPEDSEGRYVTEDYDIVSYKHELRDETGAFENRGGGVDYLFDENGILWAVDISYRFFDHP